MTEPKVYYIHTTDIEDATNNGENGVVLKSDHDKLKQELRETLKSDLVLLERKEAEIGKLKQQLERAEKIINSYKDAENFGDVIITIGLAKKYFTEKGGGE